MKKLAIILLSLLLVFTLAGCTDMPNNDSEETDSSTYTEEPAETEKADTVFNKNEFASNEYVLVEQALQSQITKKKLLQVYKRDFIPSGCNACVIVYADNETQGVYMTDNHIETHVKIEDYAMADTTAKTRQYYIENNKLVEIK